LEGLNQSGHRCGQPERAERLCGAVPGRRIEVVQRRSQNINSLRVPQPGEGLGQPVLQIGGTAVLDLRQQKPDDRCAEHPEGGGSIPANQVDGVLKTGHQCIGSGHGFEASERQRRAGSDVGVGMRQRPQQLIGQVFINRGADRVSPQDESGKTTSGRSFAGLLTCLETG
jgi:hypothetical protein